MSQKGSSSPFGFCWVTLIAHTRCLYSSDQSARKLWFELSLSFERLCHAVAHSFELHLRLVADVFPPLGIASAADYLPPDFTNFAMLSTTLGASSSDSQRAAFLETLIRSQIGSQTGTAHEIVGSDHWVAQAMREIVPELSKHVRGRVRIGLTTPDFLFPQMTLRTEPKPAVRSPGFIEYVYVAFTNASAFSPTDTMLPSQRAKILMMAQSAISLLALALVAARTVTIIT